MQPLDLEVGAGAFPSATFLKAIGNLEPLINSALKKNNDGRYGKNPKMLQHYYQYQVVMKPSPDDFQELYLDSKNSG